MRAHPCRLFPLVGLLAVCGLCDNPRSHLMADPVSPRLTPSGFLVTIGPAFSLTLRQGTEYVSDTVLQEKKGLTTRLFGGTVEAAFDNSDRNGKWHLLPFAALSAFPFQEGYVDDVYRESEKCQFYHFAFGAALGLSDPCSGKGIRRYAAAGPSFNMLVYQGNSVWIRPAWGACGRAGLVLPLDRGRPLIFEAVYRYAFYRRYYWGYALDMEEHSHVFVLSAGIGM